MSLLFMNEYVSIGDISEFMQNEENKRLMAIIDSWFQTRTEQKNLKDFLCFIQCISIFFGIAKKEMQELEGIFTDRIVGNA